jgi:hypothetical protein
MPDWIVTLLFQSFLSERQPVAISIIVRAKFQCACRLRARLRHVDQRGECQLSGAFRKSRFKVVKTGFDPQPTSSLIASWLVGSSSRLRKRPGFFAGPSPLLNSEGFDLEIHTAHAAATRRHAAAAGVLLRHFGHHGFRGDQKRGN